MKKMVIIIIICTISIFVGYKSYEILNKSKQFENGKREQCMKPDLMGELESISESEIILKVIKLNMPNDNENNNDGLQIEYTGEKKTIIISNNTKILKNCMSEKRMQQDEINISNLKVGDVLSLTYKEDKSTIDKIILDEMRNNKISNNN